MFTIKFTTAYKKSYKLMKKRGLNLSLLDSVVYMLANGDTLPEKYHDHALKGKFKGFRECHIQPDWLLIYAIDDDRLILVASRTGTHADLFDM